MAREHAHTSDDTYLVTWTVEPGEQGQRVDVFLKSKYRRLTRGQIQNSIKEGRVTLNHEPVKPSRILRPGDRVFVVSVRGGEPEVDFNFRVIHEDETILVVDKPGNLPVHPSGRYFFNTLLTQLRVVNRNEVDQRKEFYVVHRVDRETSGVLVLAKTPVAANSLVKQFEGRRTQKEYLAIVKGVVEKDAFDCDQPLSRDPKSDVKLKMNVVEMGPDGEPLWVPKGEVLQALTHVEVLHRLRNYTVVRCRPHTGRQHQIRVHLWAAGHPLVGDKLYGTTQDLFLKNITTNVSIEVEPGVWLARHGLHAHRLSFEHPATGNPVEFRSEMPRDLGEFLEKVRY